MDVGLRVTCEIRDPLPVDQDYAFRVSVPADDDRPPIDVTITPTGGHIAASRAVALPAGLAAHLGSGTVVSEWPEPERTSLREATLPLGRALERVFGLVVQELRKHEHHTLVNSSVEWQSDGVGWVPVAPPEYVVVDWSHVSYRLSASNNGHIQRLLARGETPLAAYEYLNEAWRRHDERFAWIAATTAAELAIKEMLGRLEPTLLPLLLEVPSPPLRKLYGEVLEAVAGERSPFLSALHKGAEIRNRLVHRPDSEPPTAPEVREYLHKVRDAIEHLLVLDRCRDMNGRADP